MLNVVMKDMAPLVNKSSKRERGDAKEVLKTMILVQVMRNKKEMNEK